MGRNAERSRKLLLPANAATCSNDVNGDGRVSKDEFTGRAKDWLARLDSNGDGVVTTDDFGPGRRGKNRKG